MAHARNSPRRNPGAQAADASTDDTRADDDSAQLMPPADPSAPIAPAGGGDDNDLDSIINSADCKIRVNVRVCEQLPDGSIVELHRHDPRVDVRVDIDVRLNRGRYSS